MTRLLQISAVLTLLGLALMVWSMVAPTPLPVILAMSIGQLLGTLAFGMFGYAALVDQLRKQRAKGEAATVAARGAGSSSAGSSSAGSSSAGSSSAGSSSAGSSAAGSSTSARSAASMVMPSATDPVREASP